MRTRISEIVSSIDFYNREGDSDSGSWDIKTEFITSPDMTLVEDDGVVDVIKEFFDYKGNTDDIILSNKTVAMRNEYVMTFEEYVRNNPNVHSNFQKRPPQDPDYDDRPRGWREDDLDDDFDDEEE